MYDDVIGGSYGVILVRIVELTRQEACGGRTRCGVFTWNRDDTGAAYFNFVVQYVCCLWRNAILLMSNSNQKFVERSMHSIHISMIQSSTRHAIAIIDEYGFSGAKDLIEYSQCCRNTLQNTAMQCNNLFQLHYEFAGCTVMVQPTIQISHHISVLTPSNNTPCAHICDIYESLVSFETLPLVN